ncbi:hypothetical protein [Roseobacter sp. MH60115]|uniref:hypothetical protein n=1 Tax=Roseobacter sp. MH60115 TaxID=2785324 RepID=UPI0018A279C8|nr:hypothetical protein [Roseobacter sp. MH60115]
MFSSLIKKARQKDKDASWFKLARTVWSKLKPYRGKPLRNGGLIAGSSVLAGISGAGFGISALGVGAGLIWGVVQFVISLIKTISAQLKANDYGMVPGTTEFGRGDPNVPAISDWLTDQIDSIAGLSEGDPLTLGDLRSGRNGEAPGIELRT